MIVLACFGMVSCYAVEVVAVVVFVSLSLLVFVTLARLYIILHRSTTGMRVVKALDQMGSSVRPMGSPIHLP